MRSFICDCEIYIYKSLWASMYHRGVALCNFHLYSVQCNLCVRITNVFARHMKKYVKFWQ
jgi:hypothetical protein